MGTDAIRTIEIPGLLHIIPIGGSGTLYRARQLSKDRAVALRFLDWDADASGCPRGDAAVRALQLLSQHPHVVTVYGSGQVPNGHIYLLIELLEEGSLGEWVAADGRLPCAEVLEVAVKIGGALETAHRAGIVHGRLRPESILVSSSGEPQLAGLDRAMLRGLHAFTDSIAPASVDDDLTALASTMFTLLTAIGHVDGPVKDALERCEVPAPVRGLIERCLATDHAFRPSSIRELTTAIQQVQEALGLAVTNAVVDEGAAEATAQALQQATAPPQAETKPETPKPKPQAAEPEPAEPGLKDEESELEAAEPEPGPALMPEPEPAPWLASTPLEPWSELAPPEAEPESAPRSTLVTPARLARQRCRRLVAVAALTLLAAAVALVGARLFYRERALQSAVDQPPPAVVVEQPASNRDVVYNGFRTIVDESGKLSMIVPEEWSAIRSSPWIVDGEDVGSRLEAALAVGPAGGDWGRPAAVLAASQTLGTGRTVDQVLDQLRIEAGECTYVERMPFNDNLYAGAIDAYNDCGQAGARVEILVATSKMPSHIVMVQVTRLGPRDENARDRVMETFQVSG